MKKVIKETFYLRIHKESRDKIDEKEYFEQEIGRQKQNYLQNKVSEADGF